MASSVLALAQAQTPAPVHRLDPALDQLISAHAVPEKVVEGMHFTEGPVWVRDGNYLLFSDIPGNAIMKWNHDGTLSIFRRPVFAGSFPDGAQAGSNGLTLDNTGRLLAAEHGNRRVTRTEKDGSITIVADNYEGKRLNSPNDLVVKRTGAVYFTDPPFGLRSMFGVTAQNADPSGFKETRELDFSGVFRIVRAKKGTGFQLVTQLLTKELAAPNGLAFSPDEKKLYIANSDAAHRAIWVYDVKMDGTIENGRVFIDLSKEPSMGVPDGMKVDKLGDIWSTGPGGVLIFTPEGKHLGTISFPEQPANLAWGDADGMTLYVTARTSVYRIHTNVEGLRP